MPNASPYVSRGGLKLEAALDAFDFDPAGLTCADLGCSVGGFTDCLLQRGAAHVFAVDTAYGQLAWKLRQDERVTVLERTNAIHFDPRSKIEHFPGCQLVVLDLGWTTQNKALPVARKWLPEGAGHVISLIKPHYESGGKAMRGGRKGVLPDDEAEAILRRILGELPDLGATVLGHVESPIRGGKGGNVEYLALLKF
ncbi:MAG: TlyA family RNA methyltransferase [Phycisphaeraceae bacterium]